MFKRFLNVGDEKLGSSVSELRKGGARGDHMTINCTLPLLFNQA
jgi:hypothetical protein